MYHNALQCSEFTPKSSSIVRHILHYILITNIFLLNEGSNEL